jgi:hypothetical protein
LFDATPAGDVARPRYTTPVCKRFCEKLAAYEKHEEWKKANPEAAKEAEASGGAGKDDASDDEDDDE